MSRFAPLSPGEGVRLGAIIFAVIVAAIAAAIGIQSVLHRRRLARARIRVDQAISARIAESRGPMDLREVLDAALARTASGPDVYEQILDRVDLTRFRPKLAPDVEVKSFPLRWGNDYVMVANPRAMLYYRLEPWEGALLPLMDGTRTVGDIVVERLEEEGELDAAGATQLVQILELGGFLEPVPAGLEKGLERGLDHLTPAERKIRIFLKTLSIDWTGADGFVRWRYRTLLRPFFRPVGAVVAVLVAAAGLIAFASSKGPAHTPSARARRRWNR